MFRFSRQISTFVLAAAMGLPAHAQSGPAEYPPASYTASQYVDSKGCVFVRAGIDGNVTWVPRMARNRTPVCGFQPSQVAGTTDVPASVDRGNVTIITAAAPETAAEPATSVAAPRPRILRPADRPVVAAPAPRPSVTGPTVRATAPTRVVRAPTAPVIEPRPRAAAASVAPQVATQTATPCTTLSPTGQRFITYGGTEGVRCGPQADYRPGAPELGVAPRVAAAPQAPVVVSGAVQTPSYDPQVPANAPRVFEVPRTQVQRQVTARAVTTATSPTARVMPRHVYENQLQQKGIEVPKGYRPVWTDDRLNPQRGTQTLKGKAQMEMVWTQTVPRRLVPVQVVPAQPQTARAHVSSRNATPQPSRAQPQQVARAGTYIQVGTFRTPANAQGVAQALAARGLPVRLRQHGTSQVVLTGPFATDRDLGNALTIARQAGFHDAFPRR